ncbi:MAG: PKD domain-containing protein [Anaerolineae bacterium]|nr:PKD domain-containing protein [Anaerolineae bacterium]
MVKKRLLGLVVLSAILASSILSSHGAAGDLPLSPAPQANGDVDPGGDILLSSSLYNDCDAAVAYNDNAQEFLVAWNHQGNIYGQRHDVRGVPLGENFAISVSGFYKMRPSVVYSLHADAYLVVWEDYHDGDDYDIYGQLVDANGEPLGGEIAIYPDAGNQQFPDVAFDGTNFFVVWQGPHQDDSVDIYGRFVEADGTVLPTIFPVADAGGDSRREPAVAYNGTEHEYLVIFQYGEQPNTEIHARRVDPAGVLLGDEYVVAIQEEARSPDVAAADWAAYVVVWSDRRVSGESWNIYGQVVLAGADSSFDGDNFAIAAATSIQWKPAIARAPSSGEFLVVWEDYCQEVSSGADIYGQRLQADANLDGVNFAVNEETADQLAAAVAASHGPDLYLVAWEQDTAYADSDLFGQRVSTGGLPLWYAFEISAEPGWQYSAVAAYNGQEEQYLTVWEEEDGSIYGRRLSYDGQPLEQPWAIETNGSHQNPTVVYNSFRNEYLAVWEDRDIDAIEGRKIHAAGEATTYIMIPDSDGAFDTTLAYDSVEHSYLVAWQSHSDIYGRALNDGGLPVGPLINICSEGSHQDDPQVTFDPNQQRFLVVWEDDRDGGAGDVYGRFVLPAGGLEGNEFCIAGCGDLTGREAPALDYNPDDGEYLVVYTYGDPGTDHDIYGQRLSGDGLLLGDETVIWSEADDVSQRDPQVAYVSSLNRYYVLWVDAQNSAQSGYDLYGRWLLADASPASLRLPNFVYAGDQLFPALAYDPDHELGLTVWTDYRRTVSDVYARVGTLDVEPPTPRFLRDPLVAPQGTTFTFNAWPSSDNLTPRSALIVRWDLDDDGSWDTPLSLDKVITATANLPGLHNIALAVQDLTGLSDTLSLPILVLAASGNTPPTATLTVDPLLGVAGTSFQFDASGSDDAETPGSLEVCWDWDRDGACDTAFSPTLQASRVFTQTGFHLVRAVVQDDEGLTDAADRGILVVPDEIAALEVHPWSAYVGPEENVWYVATAWDAYGNAMANPTVTWTVTLSRAGVINAAGVFTATTWAGIYPDAVQAETHNHVTDTASVRIVYPRTLYLPLVLRQ